MVVNEMGFIEIVERRKKYIETSKEYSDIELKHVNKGESTAHQEVLTDCLVMQEQEFINKYKDIAIKEIDCKVQLDRLIDSSKYEELTGYIGGILFSFALLAPEDADTIMTYYSKCDR